MAYIWQHIQWPELLLAYDGQQLSQLAYDYAKQAATQAGSVSQSDADDLISAQLDLMVSEAINSSLIEGEQLNPASIRSSIQNYLELNPAPINVADIKAENMAALVVDVRNNFAQDLSQERLFKWQQMVMAGFEQSVLHSDVEVGCWRTSAEPMQIVSGAIGYEKIHYQAPEAKNVADLMQEFLAWFNGDESRKMPGVIRAGIAHLWFETIHPFDDGNGRVGRAIAEYALAQDMGTPVLLSLSTHIEKNRKDYYQELNSASCCETTAEVNAELDAESEQTIKENITHWLTWFIETLIIAQQDASSKVLYVFAKTKFWQRHKNTQLAERQIKVINKIFSFGQEAFEHGLSAKKYAALGKCSKATATRDLADLVEKQCLTLVGKGRGVRYFISK